jgi:hypothetical protein
MVGRFGLCPYGKSLHRAARAAACEAYFYRTGIATGDSERCSTEVSRAMMFFEILPSEFSVLLNNHC